MTAKIQLLIVLSLFLPAVVGCSPSDSSNPTPDSNKLNTYAKYDTRKTDFKATSNITQKIWAYIKKGDEHKSSGRYSDALLEYMKADEMISDRSLKTIVNQALAETYVLLGDNDNAVQYYEKAEESTMNKTQARSFREKIIEIS